MKKIIALFILMVVAITGCGSNTTSTNGKGPRDFPVKWANAMIQGDEKTANSLLVEKTVALDPNKKKENDLVIQDYKLSEWKESDKKFYYRISFVDPIENKKFVEDMEVVKTKDGWKKPSYSELRNLEEIVQNKKLKEVIVREWDNK